jgi:menaquinone-dependent protoporphyrinogen oxidase
MKFLILYATTEGHTHKVADFAANRLKARGDSVTVVDAAQAPWDLKPNDFDAAILAASLHDGRYQTQMIDFARKHREQLNQMPSTFLSVSLSAAGRDPDDLTNAAICADFFRKETGWANGDVYHVAGAIRFGEYDFFKRWIMKIIAWERSLDVTGIQELELTDWEALAKAVDSFRNRAAEQQPAAPAA